MPIRITQYIVAAFILFIFHSQCLSGTTYYDSESNPISREEYHRLLNKSAKPVEVIKTPSPPLPGPPSDASKDEIPLTTLPEKEEVPLTVPPEKEKADSHGLKGVTTDDARVIDRRLYEKAYKKAMETGDFSDLEKWREERRKKIIKGDQSD